MLENYPFIKIMLIIIALMIAVLFMTVIGIMIGTYRKRKKMSDSLITPMFGMAEEKLREVQAQKQADDAAEEETVSAKVVAKRTNVWGQHARTVYYATFENSARERTELMLSGKDYGMIAEGDEGTLTHRGSQFVRFERR